MRDLHVSIMDGDPIHVTVDSRQRITIPKRVFHTVPGGVFREVYNFHKNKNERSYLTCLFHGTWFMWFKPVKTRRVTVPYEPGDRLCLELRYREDEWHSEYYLNCTKEGPYLNG